jgi:hypothetical protein
MAGSRGLRVRLAGRVIVLDPDDRVLLFRYDDGLPNGRHWCTPGGGLNDGEDYPAGARRELTEETGDDSGGIGAWRWGTRAEMDATVEAIWPAGLGDAIRGALG